MDFKKTALSAAIASGLTLAASQGMAAANTEVGANPAAQQKPVMLAGAHKASERCNPCAAKRGCNPCNPCAAKKGCNPCAAKHGCNPCAAKKGCNPCNPCAAKKGCNPCNPCAAKKKKY